MLTRMRGTAAILAQQPATRVRWFNSSVRVRILESPAAVPATWLRALLPKRLFNTLRRERNRPQPNSRRVENSIRKSPSDRRH
jgi:hypothetical protein